MLNDTSAHDAQRRLRAILARPRTADAYRARMAGYLQTMLSHMRAEMAKLGDAGFSYEASAIEAFDQRAAELVALLQAGPMRHDLAHEARVLIEAHAAVARTDEPLQRLLRRVEGRATDGSL
jgi:hypothetical protein